MRRLRFRGRGSSNPSEALPNREAVLAAARLCNDDGRPVLQPHRAHVPASRNTELMSQLAATRAEYHTAAAAALLPGPAILTIFHSFMCQNQAFWKLKKPYIHNCTCAHAFMG